MLLFFKNNDNLIRWDGMNRASDGAYVNDATVTFSLKDSDEVELVAGTMPYVAGTNGRYQGVVRSTIDLGDADGVVWLEVTADAGALDGFRRIQGRVAHRKEN